MCEALAPEPADGFVPFNFYSGSGKILKTIHYRIDGDLFTVRLGDCEKTWLVEKNREFTFKVLKTKIKAIDGICGFQRFIENAARLTERGPDIYNSSVHGLLVKMVQ